MIVSSDDRTFPWKPTFFYPVTLTLEFGLLFEKFYHVNKNLIVSTKSFDISHEYSCDKICLLAFYLFILTFDQLKKMTLVIASK